MHGVLTGFGFGGIRVKINTASYVLKYIMSSFSLVVHNCVLQVRLTAFQSLGAFISTFADPLLTGLHLSDCGSIVYSPPSAANNSGSPLSTSVTWVVVIISN